MSQISPAEAQKLLTKLDPDLFRPELQSTDEEEQTDMRMLEKGWQIDGWAFAREIPALFDNRRGQYIGMFMHESKGLKWCQFPTVNFAEIGGRFKDRQ